MATPAMLARRHTRIPYSTTGTTVVTLAGQVTTARTTSLDTKFTHKVAMAGDHRDYLTEIMARIKKQFTGV